MGRGGRRRGLFKRNLKLCLAAYFSSSCHTISGELVVLTGWRSSRRRVSSARKGAFCAGAAVMARPSLSGSTQKPPATAAALRVSGARRAPGGARDRGRGRDRDRDRDRGRGRDRDRDGIGMG